MDCELVQEIADKMKCDVREIEKWQWRLMDIYGNFVIDIYFKRNRQGKVLRNKTFEWNTQKWGELKDEKDLENKIKNNYNYERTNYRQKNTFNRY